MKRFLKKLILYLIPVGIYAGVCESLFSIYKETTPLDVVINKQYQSDSECYYLRNFFNTSPSRYKIGMAFKKDADILVVGQSTVLQFRSTMFHPFEKSFYNMGFSINNMDELESLISLIQRGKLHRPKLLIIGLDISLIKKTSAQGLNNEIINPHEDEIFQPKFHAAAAQTMFKFMFSGNRSAEIRKKDLGFGYWGTKGTGFRKDGSLHYAEDIAKYIKHPQFRDPGNYKQLLKDGEYIFTKPFDIDPKLLNRLIKTIQSVQLSGIQVLIFMPPVSDDFSNYFSKFNDFSAFFKSYKHLGDILRNKNIDVIKPITPKEKNLSDHYMLDGIHPGEVLVARLLSDHLKNEKPKGILSKIDTAHLRQLINSRNTIPLSFMLDTAVFGTSPISGSK